MNQLWSRLEQLLIEYSPDLHLFNSSRTGVDYTIFFRLLADVADKKSNPIEILEKCVYGETLHTSPYLQEEWKKWFREYITHVRNTFVSS